MNSILQLTNRVISHQRLSTLDLQFTKLQNPGGRKLWKTETFLTQASQNRYLTWLVHWLISLPNYINSKSLSRNRHGSQSTYIPWLKELFLQIENVANPGIWLWLPFVNHNNPYRQKTVHSGQSLLAGKTKNNHPS